MKYDGAAVQAQQVKRKPNGLEKGAYNSYIENILSGIVKDRIGYNPQFIEEHKEFFSRMNRTEPDPNATDELYEELLAAQKADGQGVSKE